MGHYDTFDPSPFGTHRRSLGYLRPGQRVLEVGCSSGALTERIQALGCPVVGIERDAESAAKARPFCESVLVGDVESMPFGLPPASFDALLLLDVLEHLVDPAAAIRRLLPYVRPSGRIIAAIPNVGHWAIRWHLLRGRFDYEESGILDRTHLHFYTRAAARVLLEASGIEVLEEDVVPDVPLLRHKPRLARLNYRVARALPTWLSTETIFVGRPRRTVSSP